MEETVEKGNLFGITADDRYFLPNHKIKDVGLLQIKLGRPLTKDELRQFQRCRDCTIHID